MAKDSRASAILGGEKKKKDQPKKGSQVRGKKKAHSVYARRVENGYHSETKFKGDDGEDETQEHVHGNIEELLNHIRGNMGDEQAELQSGQEPPVEGGKQPQTPPQEMM
jgi:hypothetical protein